MSSHVVVIDKTARRHTVKVSPETILNSILVQACKKAGIEDISNYGLKHNSKSLDLSLPFRFSKLSGGAKLELIQLPKGRQTSTDVTVALQLMDGTSERLTQKFPNTTSIWSILRTFEANAALRGVKDFSITETCSPPSSGTSGSGRLFYRMPVVQIVNKELGSFQDLQQTLASMGFTGGTALLRLKHRGTEIPLEEAAEQIATFANAHPPLQTESQNSTPSTAAVVSPRVIRSVTESKDRDVGLEMQTGASETAGSTQTSEPAPEVAAPPRGAENTDSIAKPGVHDVMPTAPTSVKVFKPPESSTPHAATVEVPDDDYEPNIAQLQKFHSQLQDAARPQRLLSDQEQREKEKATREKKEKIAEVEVKVRFPDQSMIQATFKPANTAEDLYSFVRSCLRHPTQPFYLFQAPPVRRISQRQGRLILDCQFTHRTLINFAWEAESVSDRARAEPPLNGAYLSSARAVELPKPFKQSVEEDVGAAKRAGKSGSAVPGGSGGGLGNKVPKWLKLPGKK